jgi:hypothetical protein
MTTVKVEVCGVEGAGKNVTLAKQDAMRKIRASLALNYNITYIRIRNMSAIVYASPSGYSSIVLPEDLPDSKCQSLYGRGALPNETREEVVADARRNLLQLTWTAADGTRHPSATEKENRELASYFEFQLRYIEAEKRGADSNDAHSYAGRNPQTPELWQPGYRCGECEACKRLEALKPAHMPSPPFTDAADMLDAALATTRAVAENPCEKVPPWART